MKPSDPVLIVLLPRPSDLDAARAGWYRMPMRHAPAALMRTRCLAFYQPAAFGPEGRWQVAWWAEIRSVGSQQRHELLPDEPDHPRSQEWYAVVELGPLQRLDPPLRASQGRRLLYVPTTWGKLTSSPSLDELLAHAPRPIADDMLYTLIQQQLEGAEATFQQPRLFEEEDDLWIGNDE